MNRILPCIVLALLSSCTTTFSQNIHLYFGDTVYVSPNQDFWVDLRVTGFSDVAVFSYTLQYDSTRVTFLEHQLSAVPDIIINAEPTLLKAAWVSSSGMGETLPDSSVLLRLHFKARAVAPATTLVDWSSTPLPTEFYTFDGVNLQLAPVLTTPKVIIIRICDTQLELGTPLVFCAGDSTQIIPTCINCQGITWGNGTQSNTFWATTTGWYAATAMGFQDCEAADSIWVEEEARPVVSLPETSSICAGEIATLSADVTGNLSLQWSTGATTPDIAVTSAGGYAVTATNSAGCTASDTIQLIIKPLPLVTLPADTSLCMGETLSVSVVTQLNTTYLWNNGTTQSTINILQSGQVTLTALQNGCPAVDTMNVLFKPLPIVDLGDDLDRCVGGSAHIGVTTTPGAIYLWNSGANSAVTDVSTTGIQILQVTLNGCSNSDSIWVRFNPLPIVKLGPDRQICSGELAQLDLDIPNATINWSTGESSDQITVTPPATISVNVTVEGCGAADTIEIVEKLAPLPLDLGPDLVVCDTAHVVLQAPYDATADTYFWSNGHPGETLIVNTPGVYSVTVGREGCTVSDTITVEFQDCQTPNIYIPNIFAPNSGNENATFGVFFSDLSTITEFELHLYDRWGSPVFTGNSPTDVWDGYVRGDDAVSGVYVYWVRVVFESGKVVVRKGDVTLLQ